MIAGGLRDAVGPSGTFVAGAAFSALTLIGLLGLRGWHGRIDASRLVWLKATRHLYIFVNCNRRVPPYRFDNW